MTTKRKPRAELDREIVAKAGKWFITESLYGYYAVVNSMKRDSGKQDQSACEAAARLLNAAGKGKGK